MPLCSRRAWKTPAGFTTWPTPGCYDDGVVLPRFNPDPQTGRRRGFIMTTIQTQRPTLVYVACFYPDLTAFAGLLLSRHSHLPLQCELLCTNEELTNYSRLLPRIVSEAR